MRPRHHHPFSILLPAAPQVHHRRHIRAHLRFFHALDLTCADESRQRRNDLSLRDAPVGSRKVTFRKPNTATTGISLGLKFREGFGKGVFIDKIVDGTEAARLKQRGEIKEGDEVTMVSATFGDEMWSARGIGKMRLEKSIAVRQGMTVAFVFESKDKGSSKAAKDMAKKQQLEKDRMTRLQKQLTEEVEATKKKGGFFGGLF